MITADTITDEQQVSSEADEYDAATGDLGRPLYETRVMWREVLPSRSWRLELVAIWAAVSSLAYLCSAL